MHLQILFVNQQTYDEALPLLYSKTYRIDLTSPTPEVACQLPLPPYAPDLFMSPDVHYLESTRGLVLHKGWKTFLYQRENLSICF